MASSNRHWPSMFKSKPTYNTHQDHQWQPHACHRSSPYTSGCDDRTPEPKPRWNPKPEQIRILESIFNSGMVNPPREEIRKIRTKLQEYGQVGDANVFYWFQNRKSRSKNKNRHLQKHQNRHYQPATKMATTSSSSSSGKSSLKSVEFLLNSPTASVNQNQHSGEFFQEPYFFPVMQQPSPATTASFRQGFCLPELETVVSEGNRGGNDDRTVGSGSGMLLTDLMMSYQSGVTIKDAKSKGVEEDNAITVANITPLPSLAAVAPIFSPNVPTTTVPSTVSDIQGLKEAGPRKLIVFINDVPFEVAVGPFNIREVFGGDAVLIHSSGETVVTNQWGVTLQSLQHGAFYYLVRTFAYDHADTVDLI